MMNNKSAVEVKEIRSWNIKENIFISQKTKEQCEEQDILILPESQDESGSVFAQESISFYKFVKSSDPNIKMDFYSDKESIQERALHSFDIYMPIIFVAANILLPFVVGLVTNYVYDKMKGREHEECTINVKFIVQTGETKKELTYDGPAKEFKEAFNKIDISKL